MFYAEAILSKKGPLAKVWLAAHLERKLTKPQLLQTSIPSSVGAIIGHDTGPPLALRLSGQLLLGVARIYARKARYLLEDCSEALVRIKLAFRPGAADITSDAVVATHNAITLPEALTEFDILLPSPVRMNNAMEFEAGAAMNTSRMQDITLAEYDVSAVARGATDGIMGEEDILGRDDDFRLDLDEDFVLSPPHHDALHNLDGSAMDPEVAREAMHGLDESMIGVRPEDVSLLGKGVNADGTLNITRDDLDMHADDGVLRFGDEGDLAMASRLGDEPMMLGNTQEAALQEAEAEVLAAGGTSGRVKRRRLNISELVTNEATSLSTNEIRERLNDATDTVRVPTYLATTCTARLGDMNAATAAMRLLTVNADSPFASLFEQNVNDMEQQVPSGQFESFGAVIDEPSVFDEPRVPEADFDHFRIDDGEGDEIRLLDEPEADVLADKSVEQIERMEEESLMRLTEEQRQQQKGVRLFADTTPELDTNVDVLLGADQDADPEVSRLDTDQAGTSGYSKNTIRAIRILDTAAQADNIQATDVLTQDTASLSFNKVAHEARRDDAVTLFFELLVLKSRDFIHVTQPAPYEDVQIVPRPKLSHAASSIA
ncbi:sister chromatid cohesion protein 1 [Coemansia sp. RSA 1822]|nr:sister chromatid cohesion protein 1 [Coemansia sp. RSA 638]KAJ2123405.1 sister chromatid cohesion protein 1 [Coemansia sp. RSA 720]KAJ2542178.1 sister chromatid cohesion protein 1 [Coemansia sp. RSA 1853]KAJ2562352.1 sister chromatid cohesion protein 1 [Coemansia sp. RSA 1822]